jgi:hypothetical protein
LEGQGSQTESWCFHGFRTSVQSPSDEERSNANTRSVLPLLCYYAIPCRYAGLGPLASSVLVNTGLATSTAQLWLLVCLKPAFSADDTGLGPRHGNTTLATKSRSIQRTKQGQLQGQPRSDGREYRRLSEQLVCMPTGDFRGL